jgi:hypothetical protein
MDIGNSGPTSRKAIDGASKAVDIAKIIYTVLERGMTPGALDRLIVRGLRAKGSRSLHGFMVMLEEIHAKKRPDKYEDSHGQ